MWAPLGRIGDVRAFGGTMSLCGRMSRASLAIVRIVGLIFAVLGRHTGPGTAVPLEVEASSSSDPSQESWGEWTPHQPHYLDTPRNVTARVGESAFLPCKVSNLGDRSVTWMRQRDLHILTAGIFTYSADDRFKVVHPENSEDWTLQISFATPRDSGLYECHVNSDPKISRHVALLVRENGQLDDPSRFGFISSTTDPTPRVIIEGAPERHIQAGSVLAITCIIHHADQQAPQHVLWFHADENIDYDSPRGGVSIQTEKYRRKTKSKVMLSNVRHTDTGEYSCSPSDLPPAVITVHVQYGQNQAAVQQGGLSSAHLSRPGRHVLLLLFLLLPHVWLSP